MSGTTRVGIGWDVHRLVAGRKFVLGGIVIDHPKGPEGHSDADPLFHAVADAVLGAAGLGDLGERFSPSDPKWKDADSGSLLSHCLAEARSVGLNPAQADCIVILEEPHLGAHKEAIRRSVAQALGLADTAVNVKAKTAEGIGAVGAKEAIEAHALVVMERSRP